MSGLHGPAKHSLTGLLEGQQRRVHIHCTIVQAPANQGRRTPCSTLPKHASDETAHLASKALRTCASSPASRLRSACRCCQLNACAARAQVALSQHADLRGHSQHGSHVAPAHSCHASAGRTVAQDVRLLPATSQRLLARKAHAPHLQARSSSCAALEGAAWGCLAWLGGGWRAAAGPHADSSASQAACALRTASCLCASWRSTVKQRACSRPAKAQALITLALPALALKPATEAEDSPLLQVISLFWLQRGTGSLPGVPARLRRLQCSKVPQQHVVRDALSGCPARVACECLLLRAQVLKCCTALWATTERPRRIRVRCGSAGGGAGPAQAAGAGRRRPLHGRPPAASTFGACSCSTPALSTCPPGSTNERRWCDAPEVHGIVHQQQLPLLATWRRRLQPCCGRVVGCAALGLLDESQTQQQQRLPGAKQPTAHLPSLCREWTLLRATRFIKAQVVALPPCTQACLKHLLRAAATAENLQASPCARLSCASTLHRVVLPAAGTPHRQATQRCALACGLSAAARLAGAGCWPVQVPGAGSCDRQLGTAACACGLWWGCCSGGILQKVRLPSSGSAQRKQVGRKLPTAGAGAFCSVPALPAAAPISLQAGPGGA